jgi:hypothetical protein
VDADDACGMFTPGTFKPGDRIAASVTPKEAGFVKRAVRCEHCRFGGENCQLYIKLNRELPEVFNLETAIKPRACCNLQTPKEMSATVK